MAIGPEIRHLIADKLLALPSDPTLALVFPGQGSQQVGMTADIARSSPAARLILDAADQVLDMDLAALCVEGPPEKLTKTANAQPAILVTSLAVLAAAMESRVIEKKPHALAGHSLGEFTALVAAGSLEFEDALELVRLRGRLMATAGQGLGGTMAAIVGLEADVVEELCALSGAEPCNYNSLTQVVVGGSVEAVEKACTLAKERGGRGLPLNVSGAFHTSMMRAAATDFSEVLRSTPIAGPQIPVIGNVTAKELTRSDDVLADLSLQMTKPVLWYQTLEHMRRQGVRIFMEIGPGKALTAITKRSYPDLESRPLDGAAALASPTNV